MLHDTEPVLMVNAEKSIGFRLLRQKVFNRGQYTVARAAFRHGLFYSRVRFLRFSRLVLAVNERMRRVG